MNSRLINQTAILGSDAKRQAKLVVDWYAENKRDLPWRRKPYCDNPYAVLVSEVMLQQTQVKTVMPYWERWMKWFPNFRALAEAEEEAVLKGWEGLGYYRRARNLQKAARIVVADFGGSLPNDYEAVLGLPGIGRYTVGAICSIAFGQRVPLLDGNVARVLSRMHLLQRESDLWGEAGELVVQSSDPSALNQGLMELGATVCTPRDPMCVRCPVQSDCEASRAGRIGEFPKKVEKAKVRKRRFVAVILRDEERVLLRKREESVVNGGFWEFPNFELLGRRSLRSQIHEFLACEAKLDPLATIQHTITNNRITLKAFTARVSGPAIATRLNAQWTSVADLPIYPLSSAHAKLRRLITGPP